MLVPVSLFPQPGQELYLWVLSALNDVCVHRCPINRVIMAWAELA